ncbi:MAG: polysaccharide biosynthesis C-terminal domain-containing protein [Cytophagia bacterium]|nr:polysaccharide biosynthesis C-terminal domain-containing protein [Cytophagia bacterium]
MKKLFQKNLSHTVYSFAGQISFLLSNFVLFLYLAKNYDQATFGHWALFITTVSILDGLRQGFVQNGLARLIIKDPDNQEIKSTGLLLNYSIIALTSSFLLILSLFTNEEISMLYLQGYKVLLVFATIQYLNSIIQAQHQFKRYFLLNLVYLISFTAVLSIQILVYGKPALTIIINLMLLSIIPVVFMVLVRKEVRLVKPQKTTIKELVQFGKYSSGTNLLSLLFQRTDLLMINYFLDPTAVAIFHFANKIINYAELPLQALSQVIYPRIAASHLQNNSIELNKTYGSSILWLLAFIVPMTMTVIVFNNSIINLIGSNSYASASTVIIILCVASFFKPWGRVFGLILDAVGKPKINFYMLVFSLLVNVLMNWILIPLYGVYGAAMATSSSVIITIIIGQLNIRRILAINPMQEVIDSLKSIYQLKLEKKWN